MVSITNGCVVSPAFVFLLLVQKKLLVVSLVRS
jgi:hypothetical protein